MIGLELYKTYQAFNLHFNDKVDYDCLTYNFKTRVNEDSFKKSKFRWQFVGMEKKLHEKPLRYISMHVFEMNGNQYVQPQKFIRDISRSLDINQDTILKTTFNNDLQKLKSVYNGSIDMFESSGLYPNIYQDYLDGTIEYKTLILISVFIKDVINNETSRDIIAWPKYVREANKVKGLFKYFFDKKKVEEIFTRAYLN